jgi:hypothetical protein
MKGVCVIVRVGIGVLVGGVVGVRVTVAVGIAAVCVGVGGASNVDGAQPIRAIIKIMISIGALE